jgi:adenylate cyclase
MIFSLQKRFLILLLLPVSLVLLITGVTAFMYARSNLMDQWSSSARLRLEKAAHKIEMRLDEKRYIMEIIAEAASTPEHGATQMFLVQKLADQPGVSFVDLQTFTLNKGAKDPTTESFFPNGLNLSYESVRRTNQYLLAPDQRRGKRILWDDPGDKSANRMEMPHMTPPGAMQGGDGPASGIMTEPFSVSVDEGGNFLSLIKIFGGREGTPLKMILAKITFDSFMKGILEAGEWKTSHASLVRSDGTYLAHTSPALNNATRLGENGDPLERKVLAEMKKKHFGTLIGKGNFNDRVIGFYKVPSTDWFLVLKSQGSVILAPINHFRSNYLLLGVASLMVIWMLIRYSTRPVAKSVSEISEAAVAVEKGDYRVHVSEERSDEIGHLARRFNRMVSGLKERDLIEHTFGRYVDKSIARKLLDRPEALRLGGEKHLATIMMADLRGFTQIAEKLRPEEVISILNRYFGAMITVIDKHRGIIVDFFGDSVLVFFDGLEADVTARASDAVKCAIEMQRALESVSRRNQENGLPPLEMGIGIHTGEVIIGNIGSESRAKYGIVGSPVNETNRIQSEARGRVILVSDRTYEMLAEQIEVGPKCKACLKGLEGTRDLYPVIGFAKGR